MVINAPHLSIENLITNDNVEILNKSKFRLLGRIDNVINSGGVKIQPEQIEMKLSADFPPHFFIGALPNDVLGEELVLALEKNQDFEIKKLAEVVKKHSKIRKLEQPKAIVLYERFHRTFSGKIKRKKTLRIPYVERLDL